MATENKKAPKAKTVKRLAWQVRAAWGNARAWKRSMFREQWELDAFRKCARLERKMAEHPRALPLLTELMNAYRETGQDARRLEVMRRLRDIEPKPVPDFLWDEQPKVYGNNIDSWCAKIKDFVTDRCMEVIHFNHIKNLLDVRIDNAKAVCAALVKKGVLEPCDKATSTGIYRVCNSNIMEM